MRYGCTNLGFMYFCTLVFLMVKKKQHADI
jgi:hypothetical protein